MNANASLTYTPQREFTPFRTRNSSAARERKLISMAQDGDLEAFNELILNYQDTVYRQACWMLNDEVAAEDATQEVFLLVYRHIHTFRGDFFRSWLLRIAMNYCLDQIRYIQRRPTQPLEPVDEEGDDLEPAWLRDSSASPEQEVERSELGEDIIACVRKLAWEYRQAILLVDLQQLNYEEASRVMHIPIGTLKSRLARARQKLCKDFQKL